MGYINCIQEVEMIVELQFIRWMKTVAEFRDIAEELDEIGAVTGSKIKSVRQPFMDKWTQISTFQPDLFKKRTT